MKGFLVYAIEDVKLACKLFGKPGVPVIASDGRYNTEVITDGKTVLIYPTRNNDKLIEILLWIYENHEQWNDMKANCIEKAYQYLPTTVIEVLCQKLA